MCTCPFVVSCVGLGEAGGGGAKACEKKPPMELQGLGPGARSPRGSISFERIGAGSSALNTFCHIAVETRAVFFRNAKDDQPTLRVHFAVAGCSAMSHVSMRALNQVCLPFGWLK